ncbi:MAG: hypothetical protein EHM49_02090, partial [Deltaproteobacteria bacterium]
MEKKTKIRDLMLAIFALRAETFKGVYTTMTSRGLMFLSGGAVKAKYINPPSDWGSDTSIKKFYTTLHAALRAALMCGYHVQKDVIREEARVRAEKKKWGRNTTRELVETGWPREMVSAWWTIIDKNDCDARRFKDLVDTAKKDKLNFAQALGCRFGDEMQAFGWYKGGDFRGS